MSGGGRVPHGKSIGLEKAPNRRQQLERDTAIAAQFLVTIVTGRPPVIGSIRLLPPSNCEDEETWCTELSAVRT